MTNPATLRPAAALGLILLVAWGCSPAAAQQLGDREFLSVAVTDGGAPRPLVAGTRVRLTFRGTNLGASAGCNSIGGSYRVDGGRLVFDGAGMTEMACDPARDAQDQWLIAFLGSRPTITMAGSELTLEAGSVTVKLMDREVAEPDAELIGPIWSLTGIIQGDAVSSVPGTEPPTLAFHDDGTLDVFAGCNRGSGRWREVVGGLELSAIATTKMACLGPAAAIEDAVMGVLNAGSVELTIDAQSLTLRAGANGLQLTAG